MPKNRLKPFADHMAAFKEAQQLIVLRVVSWFDFMKAEPQAKLMETHKDRLIDLVDEVYEQREDEIKEAIRTGDEETLKRIRGEIIRLVLDQKPTRG